MDLCQPVLVCTALYDQLGFEEHLIKLIGYEQLGGAQRILKKYLTDELARFDKRERELAYAMLEELVSSQHTKTIKTADELSLLLDVDKSEIQYLLEKFVQARLLRRIERSRNLAAYELTHEYLIRDISLDAESRERKKVEEFIEQEVNNWRNFNTLLSMERLAIITQVREQLRLDSKSLEFLLRSAIEAQYEADYWLKRVNESEQTVKILSDYSQHNSPVIRKYITELLGFQDDPATLESLLVLATKDTNMSVRLSARRSLSSLIKRQPTIINPLVNRIKQNNITDDSQLVEAVALLPQELFRIGMGGLLYKRIRFFYISWLWKWLLVNAVGFSVGLAFGEIVTETIGFAVGFLVIGAVTGMIIGAAQWSILRNYLQQQTGRWWISTSIFGFALGELIGFLIDWVIDVATLGVGGAIALGAITGMAVGTSQLYVLSKHLHKAWWWIPSSTIGGIVATIAGFAIGVSVISGFSSFVGRIPAEVIADAVGGAVAGALYGTITGITLWKLLQRPR